jgi:hypothetical protein
MNKGRTVGEKRLSENAAAVSERITINTSA